ncbi:MAG TPA: cytochrome ubiquinol oxidase subunit I [Candidatus Limnocylindrales bacterium]|nr:cytochrome ubiquinol oxidase subunit I [Candidatus Limnocylindrales bacterium]
MDPTVLARAQFALTVMFHFVFPSISIGLGLIVAILEVARWRTKRDVFARAAAFWTKVFALTFVVGVATGVVMEFEFGTNWSRYSSFVGDVFGPPLAAEALLAFFLESTFLGLLLWGGARIGSGLRALAACLVAGGAALSGLWIIIANSWMQTPAGYEVEGGRAVLVDAWAAFLNPSTLPRYAHTIASSWAMAGFLVLAVAAWYVLRGRAGDVARLSLRIGLIVAILGAGSSILTGDQSARQVAATQEAKFAAMQGLYTTTAGAPLVIWSLPPSQDPAQAPQGPEILVTRLLSFLSFGSFTAAVKGLSEFPPQEWPPVAATFLAYHNMVILGLLMGAFLAYGAWAWWRRRLERSHTWLRLAVPSFLLPALAIQLGWATAEIGRQPWIVYGLMRTADATSPVVSAGEIAASILLFGLVYVVLGALWLFLVARVIRTGPVQEAVPDESSGRVASPQPLRPAEVH